MRSYKIIFYYNVNSHHLIGAIGRHHPQGGAGLFGYSRRGSRGAPRGGHRGAPRGAYRGGFRGVPRGAPRGALRGALRGASRGGKCLSGLYALCAM